MDKQRVDPRSPYTIGVDIGGTKINAGIVRDTGEIVHHVTVATMAGEADTGSGLFKRSRG